MKFDNIVLIFKALSEDIKNVTDNSKDKYQEQLEKLCLNVRIINVLDFKYTNLDVLKTKLEAPQDYSGNILLYYHVCFANLSLNSLY